MGEERRVTAGNTGRGRSFGGSNSHCFSSATAEASRDPLALEAKPIFPKPESVRADKGKGAYGCPFPHLPAPGPDKQSSDLTVNH